MLTHLATMWDLPHLEQRVNARFDALEAQLGQRIDAGDEWLGERIDAMDRGLGQGIELLDQSVIKRLEASHAEYDRNLQNLESRFVIELGVLMTVLLGAAGALQSLLR